MCFLNTTDMFNTFHNIAAYWDSTFIRVLIFVFCVRVIPCTGKVYVCVHYNRMRLYAPHF